MKNLKALSLILTLLLIGSFTSISQAVDESLLLYFPLDEGAGVNEVNDESGNGFVGVCNGGFEWVEGQFGNAISFNGIDGYMEVEHDERLNLPGSFTIEAWFMNAGTGEKWQHLISKDYENQDMVYQITFKRVELVVQFNVGGFGNAVVGFAVEPNKWYHVAVVKNEDTNMNALYINGKFVAENAIGSVKENDASVLISARHSAVGVVYQFSVFTVDELAIYTRALTEDEINQDMEKGIGSIAVTPRGRLTAAWGALKAEAGGAR